MRPAGDDRNNGVFTGRSPPVHRFCGFGLEPPGEDERRSGPGAAAGAATDTPSGTLAGRLGLSVPYEWWPSAPLLKSYEAAGFAWVQLHSPPPSVLRDRQFCARHARAVAEALGTTSLGAILHAPGGAAARRPRRRPRLRGPALLRGRGRRRADRLPRHGPARFARKRGRAGGRGTFSRRPWSRWPSGSRSRSRSRTWRPSTPAPRRSRRSRSRFGPWRSESAQTDLGLCLDVGHAQISADLRHTGVEQLCEPVLDLVTVFHLHDNLGARWTAAGDELGVDPLRLDLHLPPGRGTLPWDRIAPAARRTPGAAGARGAPAVPAAGLGARLSRPPAARLSRPARRRSASGGG